MTSKPKSETPVDPFADLSAFRLSQDFAADLGVKKLLLKVPVRKPGRQEFFRVHPDHCYTLWPARLPGPDGRVNPWHSSALEIADLAKSAWMRMAADRSLGAYQAYKAAGELPDPEWPDRPFNELMRIAFANGYLINNEDHPVIKRLLGTA
jgi:hypothetical protein